MILMKEYVFLTTAALKMDKKHFYSDHSNGCEEDKIPHWVIPIHRGHGTLTSWIFKNFLPVVGII